MILVTGATGHVGRAVVCRLASLGHNVAAMVRDIQAASRRLPSGIALRVADYEDASALKRALAGIDDMVLISSDGDASAVMRHHANAMRQLRRPTSGILLSRASSIRTSCRHSTSHLFTETQSADWRSAVCLRPSSDAAYIPTLFSNIGLCRAKRRESLCYPQDVVGLHRSRVTTWRPPSQQ
jgi:NAD(P)-dependent dehydrogenase (short-subunit alcohol dehydrogenase family)